MWSIYNNNNTYIIYRFEHAREHALKAMRSVSMCVCFFFCSCGIERIYIFSMFLVLGSSPIPIYRNNEKKENKDNNDQKICFAHARFSVCFRSLSLSFSPHSIARSCSIQLRIQYVKRIESPLLNIRKAHLNIRYMHAECFQINILLHFFHITYLPIP